AVGLGARVTPVPPPIRGDPTTASAALRGPGVGSGPTVTGAGASAAGTLVGATGTAVGGVVSGERCAASAPAVGAGATLDSGGCAPRDVRHFERKKPPAISTAASPNRKRMRGRRPGLSCPEVAGPEAAAPEVAAAA